MIRAAAYVTVFIIKVCFTWGFAFAAWAVCAMLFVAAVPAGGSESFAVIAAGIIAALSAFCAIMVCIVHYQDMLDSIEA